MNVTLTPEQDEAVERLVKAGVFASREAALERSHEWLREEAEKLDALQAKIEKGIDQADSGNFSALTADEIMRNIEERLKSEQPNGE